MGDTKVPFCLQSCVKPLKYAIAVNDLGTEYVHRYVGKEPSGLRFNKLFLNEDGKRYIILNNANTRLEKIMRQAYTAFSVLSFYCILLNLITRQCPRIFCLQQGRLSLC